MKNIIAIALLLILSSCSDDEGYFNPILKSVDNSVWTLVENADDSYMENIELGLKDGSFITFKGNEFTIKYSFDDSSIFINGVYEYTFPMIKLKIDENYVQYKVANKKINLATTNEFLDKDKEIPFPTSFYLH